MNPLNETSEAMRIEEEELRALGASPAQAKQLRAALSGANDLEGEALWALISKRHLSADIPFSIHERLFQRVYERWIEAGKPCPVWSPSAQDIEQSNIGSWPSVDDYGALHKMSTEDPERFWSRMLEVLTIKGRDSAARMVDLSQGAERARWFPKMRLNIAESCFEGRDPDALAITWQSEGGSLNHVTVQELSASVRAVAQSLRGLGFRPGDAVAVDMPMTVESVEIYLGIVWAGCVAVSIADSFAPDEIATRLRISDAVGIFTTDVILRGGKELPLYERVVAADSPRVICLPAKGPLRVSLRPGDLSWAEFKAAATNEGDDSPHIGDVDRASNILFSSGTTGDPKAIPWTHATPLKSAADGWVHHDIQPGHVVAWPTNLGWMMGPWLIYASLLNSATIALFQGAPGGRPFGTFVQDSGVTMLGVVPSLVKAWKNSECMDGLDWSKIRCFSSTGEASNAEDMRWLSSRAGYKPVIEYCGGTEIGGGYITGTRVQPQVSAAFSTPAVGNSFVLLDDQGALADAGQLCLIAPMLGSSNRLLNRDHHEVYFAEMPPGPNKAVLRRHGDQMEHIGGGYFRAQGRVDDTMNLGGIKTSSAEIERCCATSDAVHETAAIAVPPKGGGPDRLVVYVVIKAGQSAAAGALRDQFQASIRAHLNPLFKVHDVVLTDALPRTASNKVMRRVLRARYGVG